MTYNFLHNVIYFSGYLGGNLEHTSTTMSLETWNNEEVFESSLLRISTKIKIAVCNTVFKPIRSKHLVLKA